MKLKPLPPLPTWADWEDVAEALRLKRRGSELIGPCPNCGGTDRFHVRREGQRAIVGCRGCIDGGGDGFGKVLRNAFPEIYVLPLERHPVPAPDPVPAIDYQKIKAKEHDAAAKKVSERIGRCSFAQHDYLASKGLPEAVALVSENGWMMIPMRNVSGQIRSAQYISPEGKKLFQFRGETRGCFYQIGKGREVWLVEGYATGLSVREALKTRIRSFSPEIRVCFSALNLSVVGMEAIAKGRTVYAVPDHDRWTCINKHRWDGPLTQSVCPECGTDRITAPAGEYYASQLNRPYWMPPEVGFDANDFHQKYGLNALAAALIKFRFGI